MKIPLPKPGGDNVKVVTEEAFNSLVFHALAIRLPIRNSRFEDLDNPEAQLAFEQGCAAVLAALKTEV